MPSSSCLLPRESLSDLNGTADDAASELLDGFASPTSSPASSPLATARFAVVPIGNDDPGWKPRSCQSRPPMWLPRVPPDVARDLAVRFNATDFALHDKTWLVVEAGGTRVTGIAAVRVKPEERPDRPDAF